MTKLLITGPPASGKTRMLVERVSRWLREKKGEEILILTSVREEQDRLRRLLCERLGGVMGPDFATFETLPRLLFPPEKLKQPLGAVRRRILLESAVQTQRSRLRHFSASSHHPDFSSRLDRIIREFEEGGIAPEDLSSAEGALREIGLLWNGFLEAIPPEFETQNALLNRLLADGGRMKTHRFLAVSGFPDLSMLRQTVIEELAGSCEEAVLTLPDGGDETAWAVSRRSIDFFRSAGWSGAESSPPAESEVPGLPFLQDGVQAAAAEETIEVLEGANPLDEMERAVWAVKRIVRGGARWEDCAVLVRDLKASRPLIQAVLRRENIPYSLRGARSVRDSLIFNGALEILSLAGSSWERERVFRLLKNGWGDPALSFEEAGRLEAEAARSRIFHRLDRFLSMRGVAALDSLKGRLDASNLLSVMEQLGAGRIKQENPFEQRVWERLTAVMEAVPRASARELLNRLKNLARDMSVQEDARGRRGVWVSSFASARGERFEFVVIPGLNEGIFPTAGGGEGVLREAERRRLGMESADRGAREGMERSFAWTAFTRAKRKLIVTYSRSNQKGNPLSPSVFLADLEKRLGSERYARILRRAGSAHLPSIDEAAGLEAMIPRVAWESSRARRTPLGREESYLLRALALNLGIEGVLREDSSFTRGDLHLSDEELRCIEAKEVMSPSQLESYAACPYRYFCEHLLRLEEWPEALDGRVRGTITHESLKEFFAHHPKLDEEQKEAYLADYRKMVESILEREGAGTLTETQRREILSERTAEFRVQLDEELARNKDWRPEKLEIDFGREGSPYPALVVEDKADQLRIKGRIDRIDCSASGAAVVVDYKRSVESAKKRELQELRSLQLPLYLLAVREVMGLKAEGFAFLATRSSSDLKAGEGRGFAPGYAGLGSARSSYWKDPSELEAHLKKVKEKVIQIKKDLTAGGFPRDPSHCAAGGFCAFADLCRLSAEARKEDES